MTVDLTDAYVTMTIATRIEQTGDNTWTKAAILKAIADARSNGLAWPAIAHGLITAAADPATQWPGRLQHVTDAHRQPHRVVPDQPPPYRPERVRPADPAVRDAALAEARAALTRTDGSRLPVNQESQDAASTAGGKR